MVYHIIYIIIHIYCKYIYIYIILYHICMAYPSWWTMSWTHMDGDGWWLLRCVTPIELQEVFFLVGWRATANHFLWLGFGDLTDLGDLGGRLGGSQCSSSEWRSVWVSNNRGKNTISSSIDSKMIGRIAGSMFFLVDTWNLKPLGASLSKQCSSQWANVSCQQRPCTWSIVSGGNRSLLPVGIIPIVKLIASPTVSPSYAKQGFNPMYTHNYIPRSLCIYVRMISIYLTI